MSTYGTIKLFVFTRTPVQVMHFITSVSNKLKSAIKFTFNTRWAKRRYTVILYYILYTASLLSNHLVHTKF